MESSREDGLRYVVCFVVTPGVRAVTIPCHHQRHPEPKIIPAIRSEWITMDSNSKNTFIAVGICIIIMLAWGPISERMGWAPKKPSVQQEVVETQQSEQAKQEKSAKLAEAEKAILPAPAAPALPVFTPSAGKEIKIDTPLYTAIIYSGGATLRSFVLKNYDMTIEADSPKVNMISPEAAMTAAPLGMTVNGQPSWSTGQWAFEGSDLNLAAGEKGELTFTGIVNGIRVVRTISFDADSYLLSEKTVIGTVDGSAKTIRLGTLVAATLFDEGKYNPFRLAWSNDGSFDDENSASKLTEQGIIEQGNFPWAGVMSNYFMNIVAPGDTSSLTLKGRVQNDVWRLALERPEQEIPAGGVISTSNSWWIGPKDRNLLSTAPNDMISAIDFGFFRIIARPLLVILDFFHSFVSNWGIAILLLVCLIRIVFWPLSQKSYKSMNQMKKLQPMMEKLKEKYKDDKEGLNREVMQLYKTYKINPAGGCLPILIQIPVFIGLYQALLNAIELRHAAFIDHIPFTDIVWLADLSAADPYYISPIIMGGTMFLQQRLSPAAGDPTQQKIMMLLPVIFTVMFVNFPSGLVVYWLCNNILSIGQQWWMLRKA